MGYQKIKAGKAEFVECICDKCGRQIKLVMGLPVPGVIRGSKTFHAKCWAEISDSKESEVNHE